MTQIIITLENKSWIDTIVAAIGKLKGVLKTEVVNTNTVAEEKPKLSEIWNSWEGETSAEETIDAIYSARSSNMEPLKF